MLKVQQRKDLYEDVYQDVLQNCEQITSAENMEALQKEAQTVRMLYQQSNVSFIVP